MSENPKGHRVREPVQAWLDRPDALLLDELATRLNESKAEVIRRAIRVLARESAEADRPGSALGALAGTLDHANLPADLAERHDTYLYGEKPRAGTKTRRR